MRRSEIKRTSLLPRGPGPRRSSRIKKSRKRMRKAGKGGRENRRALSVFKRECARLGVERCEVRYEGCQGHPDTWAHGRRRRFLKEGELETFAVAACTVCHRVLDEVLSREDCAKEVTRLIGLRPERYLEAA